MNEIKFDVTITFSKLMALLVFLGAFVLTYLMEDSNIFIIGTSAGSAILINREYQTHKLK